MTAEEKKPASGEEQKEKIWSHDQEVDRWKDEYHNLKKELENLTPEMDVLGEMENFDASNIPREIQEKRVEPRYNFQPKKSVQIFAHIGPKAFRILNISVGGVAFFSDTYFEPDTNLLLSALGMVALDVDVLDCELKETNPDFMEYEYLVRAKFSPRVNGYLVYVLSREMYLKQIAEKED